MGLLLVLLVSEFDTFFARAGPGGGPRSGLRRPVGAPVLQATDWR